MPHLVMNVLLVGQVPLDKDCVTRIVFYEQHRNWLRYHICSLNRRETEISRSSFLGTNQGSLCLYSERAASSVNRAGDKVADGNGRGVLQKVAGKVIESVDLYPVFPDLFEQRPEQGDLLHAFDFRVDREDVQLVRRHERKVMRDDAFLGIFRPAEQLIQRRKRGRYLGCLIHHAADAWEEWMRAAGIAAIQQVCIVVGLEAETVCLPASGARGLCRFAEDPFEFLPCLAELLGDLIAV